jgi:hypothetical protein
MNHENRGPWYLITALVVGVSFGLVYSWILAPVEYIDTAPASLREDFKDGYRALIAAAFSANGDLIRAQHRLALLEEEDIIQNLTRQAERAQAEGKSSTEVQNLNVLALALERSLSSTPIVSISTPIPTTALPSPTATQPAEETPSPAPETAAPTPTPQPRLTNPSPTPTLTPTIRPFAPTLTPLPSRTATPTQGAPFVLKQEVAHVCSPPRTEPLIIVEAQDKAGEQIPGVQVFVFWQGGEDRFFTGLKPEFGPGYADFEMQPGVTYTVQLAQGGQPVTGLSANECEGSSRERHWGAWRLVFTQP